MRNKNRNANRKDPLGIGSGPKRFVFIRNEQDEAPTTEAEVKVRDLADEVEAQAREVDQAIRDLVDEVNAMPGAHAKLPETDAPLLTRQDAGEVMFRLDDQDEFKQSEHADRFADIIIEIMCLTTEPDDNSLIAQTLRNAKEQATA